MAPGPAVKRSTLETLGQRLKKARERTGKSTRDLEDELRRIGEETSRDLQHASVNKFENDKRVPRAEYLQAFCRLTKTNPTWLLLGEGPMELDEARRTDRRDGELYVARKVGKALMDAIDKRDRTELASRLRDAAGEGTGGDGSE